MDEVTTSLDEATAKRVLNAIDKTFADCTILMVDHRESALEHMDYSLELHAGEPISLMDRTEVHVRTVEAIHERTALEQEFKGVYGEMTSRTGEVAEGPPRYFAKSSASSSQSQ